MELSDVVIVDCETTGLDSRCCILQIGAVDGEHPDNQFDGTTYARRGARIEPYALIVNGQAGLHNRKDKEHPNQLLQRFYDWFKATGKNVIAGAKPTFDIRFLTEGLEQARILEKGDLPIFGHHGYCLNGLTEQHATLVHPREWEERANWQGMPNARHCFAYTGMIDEPKPHLALRGAIWEAEAFSRILYGRNLFEQFTDQPIPKYLLEHPMVSLRMS